MRPTDDSSKLQIRSIEKILISNFWLIKQVRSTDNFSEFSIFNSWCKCALLRKFKMITGFWLLTSGLKNQWGVGPINSNIRWSSSDKGNCNRRYWSLGLSVWVLLSMGGTLIVKTFRGSLESLEPEELTEARPSKSEGPMGLSVIINPFALIVV